MMESKTCNCCGKSCHMMMYCLNREVKTKGRTELNLMVHVKRFQEVDDCSHSSLVVLGKAPLMMCGCVSLINISCISLCMVFMH